MATTKIRSSSILDGQVANADLSATVAVTGGQIADDAVTLAKMAGLVRGKIIVGDASGDPSALTVGAVNQVLKSDGTDVSWGADSGGLFSGYAIFEDQKAATVSGGTFTSGAWRTRDLNTTIANTDTTNIVLGTNQFTLLAGSYLIKWFATAVLVNAHLTSLYDVTGTSYLEYGSTENSQNDHAHSHSIKSIGATRVTPSSSNVYEIRHTCQTTRATDGFGLGSHSFGFVNSYLLVEIYKEA
jgi:hypothetical protein